MGFNSGFKGLMKFEFSGQSTQISTVMNIREVGAASFHVDRWTDMTKVIIVIPSFRREVDENYDLLGLLCNE